MESTSRNLSPPHDLHRSRQKREPGAKAVRIRVRSGCLVGLGTLPLQLQKGTEQAKEDIEEIIRILSLYFTVHLLP
jgi:hypothetical protein